VDPVPDPLLVFFLVVPGLDQAELPRSINHVGKVDVGGWFP
jgi:hypothetical protein